MDLAVSGAFTLPVQPFVSARLATSTVSSPLGSNQIGSRSAAPWTQPTTALAVAAVALVAASQGRGSRVARTRRKAAVMEEVGPDGKEPSEPEKASEPAKPPKKKFDARLQVGVGPPLDFWDPAGFCPINDEENFRKLRAAELKHGRVGMLAAIGQVVASYVQFPGFTKVPTGIKAATVAPGSYGMVAIIILSGILELVVWKESEDKEPGNFGDPLGLQSIGGYNDFWREVELNNGRGGMIAALGIIGAELASGRDAQDQLALIGDFVPFF